MIRLKNTIMPTEPGQTEVIESSMGVAGRVEWCIGEATTPILRYVVTLPKDQIKPKIEIKIQQSIFIYINEHHYCLRDNGTLMLMDCDQPTPEKDQTTTEP